MVSRWVAVELISSLAYLVSILPSAEAHNDKEDCPYDDDIGYDGFDKQGTEVAGELFEAHPPLIR